MPATSRLPVRPLSARPLPARLLLARLLLARLLLARLLLASLVALALLPTARAQADATAPAWHLAVIVSASGGGELGQRQAYAAERAARALATAGVYGQHVRVDVHDDRGDPRRAEALAREALDAGVLALVCCTSSAAGDRVAALAESTGAVLLALDAARAPEGSWVMQLAATPRAQMTAIAVHAAQEGKAALGLMTLDNAFGDDAEGAFERALADTGRTGVGVARYPPTERVLTPEALWLATREPGSVIVWGLPQDTLVAVDALRRRGYLGPVYARPASLPAGAWSRIAAHDLAAGPVVPSTSDPWLGARSAVPPVTLIQTLSPDHPNASAVHAFTTRVLPGGAEGRAPSDLVDMAMVDDALQLAHRAFEAVAELVLPPQTPLVTRRLALRDVLLSAPARPLAAGTYSPSAGDTRAAHWQGLVVVTIGTASGR